ncbi:vacuolar import and degradation protein-domain-containing protein [Chaetomium sp. MPI-CAGE-AT-0009]|nr:vacuolar import and degradation protein-domain-containing protein [Chaetomium sp. MPI-CAGE-AT-0009]
MPTPSSNRPDPPSPRFYPFSSCPDPEEQQQHPSQPASESNPASPNPRSPSSWRPRSPSAYPTDDVARPDTATSGDSRSITMSPGPQPDGDGRDVHMGHVSERTTVARDGAAEERQKPTGSRSVTSGSQNRTRVTVFVPPGDTKSTAEQLSPIPGETQDEADVWGPLDKGPRWVEDSGLMGMGLEYSHMRIMTPAPSLYLQPGSRFVGTQQSKRQRYEVEVEIKHVDMRESFMCGHLTIQGLADDHPTLTTYFEGEIIGSKYGFVTQHQEWGASEKIDFSHWNKFTAFRPYQKQMRKGVQTLIKDVDQKENIFMRWKEHFLVPDHRIRTIRNASFEGFYYVCFNQAKGEISGIYFHRKSEK